MNLLLLNNRYFFKYVLPEKKSFSFYANGFGDDIRLEILNYSDKDITLKMTYKVFDKETDMKLSSGMYKRSVKDESTTVTLKLNNTINVPYTILTYDFNDGFINRNHSMSVSYIAESSISLKRLKEFGNEYVGGVVNGVKEGFGEYTYTSKTKYIGEFKNGKREGYGTLVSAHEMYVGEFKGDAKCGMGTIYYTDGSKYYGRFMADKTCGLGIFKYKDGTYEIAKYFNDCLIGDESGDKRIYVRFKKEDFVDDTALVLKENVETLDETLALRIKSHDDKKCYLTLIYMEKDEEGRDNVKEKDLEVEFGKFVKTSYSYISDNDNKEGYIIICYMDESLSKDLDAYYYFLSNGGIFTGEMDGKYPLKGHLYISDNEYYDGSFKEGKLDGEGVYHMPDGDYIKGLFLDDMPEGVVEYIYPTGITVKRKYFAFAYPRSNGVDMYKDIEE